MHFNPNPYYPDYRPSKEASLKLYGEKTVRAKPDLVVLTIGIMTENANVKIAQEENAALSNSLLHSLKSLGIQEDNIQTLSYTITPEYDYIEGKSTLRGYRVEHLYEVTVLNIQKAGEVYETAIGAGANIARNLSFRVSNPDIYYQQALTGAIQEALEKAKIAGAALGATINPVPVSVTEESQSPSIEYKTFVASAQTAPPIQSGELSISAKVQAVFAYI
ncbi:MAG: SIMPL domain-containing protein [Ectobacillus sp.]